MAIIRHGEKDPQPVATINNKGTTRMTTDKAYEIKAGEKLQLTFVTAGEHEGHLWYPVNTADALSAQYLGAKSDPLLRGKKITTEFSVAAETPGEYDVTFGLVPAWKTSDAPKQTQTLKIVVR